MKFASTSARRSETIPAPAANGCSPLLLIDHSISYTKEGLGWFPLGWWFSAPADRSLDQLHQEGLGWFPDGSCSPLLLIDLSISYIKEGLGWFPLGSCCPLLLIDRSISYTKEGLGWFPLNPYF